MATHYQHPSAAPAIAATRLLASYDRHKLEAFIEVAIGLLDMIDGDPDLEDDDAYEEDDPSGQTDEDGFNTSFDKVRYTTGSSGAGCPISDPGGGNIEDEGQEEDWRPEGVPIAKPIYGIDQSAQPTNMAGAYRQWRRDVGWDRQ